MTDAGNQASDVVSEQNRQTTRPHSSNVARGRKTSSGQVQQPRRQRPMTAHNETPLLRVNSAATQNQLQQQPSGIDFRFASRPTSAATQPIKVASKGNLHTSD